MSDIILTTESCRYCLMCRHICPVTRLTRSEATSPHGWALLVASTRRGLLDWNAETTDLLYQCADCGLCQAHCATGQPLPYALVAARAEVVEAGRAPAALAEVEAALRRGLDAKSAEIVEGAEAALFVGSVALSGDRASLDAARALLESAGFAHGLVGRGRDSGYLAYTLGLWATARELARATVAEVARAGCRALVAVSPEDAHALKNVYPRLGVPLPEDVAVIDLAGLLAGLLDEGRLRLRRRAVDYAYHDPCQTPRFAGRWDAPRRLLAAIAEQPIGEGFWRGGRAAPCGAGGGLPWTQPKLAAGLARAALDDATRHGARTVVTEAPNCLAHLRAHAGEGVVVRGLYEVLAEGLEA